MNKWEEKSNNEIVMELLTMKEEYLVLKDKMLVDLTTMETMEQSFKLGNEMIIKRLKR